MLKEAFETAPIFVNSIISFISGTLTDNYTVVRPSHNKKTKDCTAAVVTSLSVLAMAKNSKCNSLQTTLGLIARTEGAKKIFFKSLNALNLSISYDSTKAALETISAGGENALVEWLKEGKQVCFSGDNINVTIGVAVETMSHKPTRFDHFALYAYV